MFCWSVLVVGLVFFGCVGCSARACVRSIFFGSYLILFSCVMNYVLFIDKNMLCLCVCVRVFVRLFFICVCFCGFFFSISDFFFLLFSALQFLAGLATLYLCVIFLVFVWFLFVVACWVGL